MLPRTTVKCTAFGIGCVQCASACNEIFINYCFDHLSKAISFAMNSAMNSVSYRTVKDKTGKN